VTARTGVAVVARDRVVRVLAAVDAITRVVGADVAVAAVDRRPNARRRAARALVPRGTDAPVAAGRSGGIDLAGRRAAVAVEPGAIVALLGHVQDPVATDRRDLADEGSEEVRPDVAPGQSGSFDAEEVLTARAPGDRLIRQRRPDGAGRRGDEPALEREEGSDVAVLRYLELSARRVPDVLREVDGAERSRLQVQLAEGVRDPVGGASDEVAHPHAYAREHDLLPGYDRPVQERALQRQHDPRPHRTRDHVRDAAPVEELVREVVGEADRLVRIGE